MTRKVWVKLAALLLLSGCARWQGAQSPPPPPDEAHAIAAELVTEVGPRFAGTAGDARAVHWAVAKLAALGFRNVRAEPVTVPRWERGTIHVELLPSIGKGQPQPLEAIALGGSVATPAGGIEGEVLAVPSLEALKQLPESAVRGRIVYLNARMERLQDSGGYRKASPLRRNGPAEASRKGAVALLMRSLGTGQHGGAHTGSTRYGDARPIPAAALALPDADRLDALLGRNQPVRVRLTLGPVDRGEAQSANVIGEIPGTTAELILLGAHLDSWDNSPGANDDAAGVGIVIAAARAAAAAGPLRHTLRVVLFANEEFGASGAKAYAAAHGAEPHTVALEADSGSGVPWRLQANVAAADWEFVVQQAAALGLEAGANGKDGGVDLAPLRPYGIPELIVSQDVRAYFDVHHTAHDTVDKLDRAGLARMTQVFSVLVRAVDQHASLERVPPHPAPAPIPSLQPPTHGAPP